MSMMMSNMFTREMKNFIFPLMNNVVLQQGPRNKKLFQGVQEEFEDHYYNDITMIVLSNHFDGGYSNVYHLSNYLRILL